MFVITGQSFEHSWGKPLAVAPNKESVEDFCKNEFIRSWKRLNSLILEDTIEIFYKDSDEYNAKELVVTSDNVDVTITKTTLKFEVHKVPYAEKGSSESSKDSVDNFFDT